MSEREYVVIVKADVDIEAFDAEVAADTGAGQIPNRAVTVANPRIGSKRMTHWMLTDEEAETLAQDERVVAVEIPPDQRTDIEIGFHASQTSIFQRESGNNSTWVNWGLRRCIEEKNDDIFNDDTTLTGDYLYALDGTGVDFIVQDSGIQADHPEFEDAAGVSRVQQIDWFAGSGIVGETQDSNFYTDYDGHGTHCAGISVGKTFGWAKNARIYAQKLNGLEGTSDPNDGISITNAFDCIRIWHNNKSGADANRPTVVNMSWGYGTTRTGNPTSGTYRGTAWTYGVDYTTRSELEAATGVNQNRTSVSGVSACRLSTRNATVDAEIEDMVAAGIHVVIAAGNNYNKVEASGGDDYDNEVVWSGVTTTYHRGSSPLSTNAYMVASLDSTIQSSIVPGGRLDRDKTSIFSSRGPGCDIWAPGSNIMSACSTPYNTSKFSPIAYFDDSNFYQMSISGTSMAAPQVAGLLCLHLESNPTLTPAQLKSRILADAKSVVYSTGTNADYGEISTSTFGQTTKIIYSRYASANAFSITKE
jgi:subtilisin family serine protease